MTYTKNIIRAGVALTVVLMTSCGNSDNTENQAAAYVTDQPEETLQSDAPDSALASDTLDVAEAEIPEWMPENVTITPSGLGIVIENPGNDRRAAATTPVTLHYRGKLTNGTVFDSSYDRGEPATFSSVHVIPGFGEGIRMIGEGGKATLYIPSNLGYGPGGAGTVIGPNENLIFDIEVLKIAD